MDEPMNRFEQRLESALRDYVERPESSWEPAAVVADVTSRARVAGPPRASWFMPARLATAAVVILAVGLTAVVGIRLVDRSSSGSSASMAVVNGVDYLVGLPRGMRIEARELTPYAEVESGNSLEKFADLTAFSLNGLDPLAVLVVRAAPGFSDDNGPYPEYLSLRGPEDFYPEICDFYEPGHAGSPTECHPPIPETAEPSHSVAATRYPVPSPSASPSPLASSSASPSPTALPGPSATVYDAEHVSDYLVVLLNERTGEVGCATENHVTWDVRHFEQRAQALVDGGGEGMEVDGDLVRGSLLDTIEVFGGTELAATQGPDIAWYLSDPGHIDLVGRRDIDAELIALQLRRILVQDGHEVWWRTHDYISVSDGPC